MKVLTIALLSLKRILRDRIALFFILLLPTMIIGLIGFAIFGAAGSGVNSAQVGVLGGESGPLARELVASIGGSDDVRISHYTDLDAARRDLRRETIDAAILIPDDYDQKLRQGSSAEVEFYSPTVDPNPGIRSLVASAVAGQGARAKAAAFALREGGGTFDENLARAGQLASRVEGRITVTTEVTGRELATSPVPEGFRYPAASNLVLFVFITSLAGSAQLIEARQLGISARMLSTPTPLGAIVLGNTLGRFALAGFQALFIFVAGLFLFRIEWGDPAGTAALVLLFALVGTAVGMLAGTIFRTPEQASAVGPPVGIALGMLGGCMWPLEIVPSAMRTLGHVTPHAWAMDAFVDLIGRGESLTSILPELAVLAGFTLVLLPLAVLRFRTALTG